MQDPAVCVMLPDRFEPTPHEGGPSQAEGNAVALDRQGRNLRAGPHLRMQVQKLVGTRHSGASCRNITVRLPGLAVYFLNMKIMRQERLDEKAVLVVGVSGVVLVHVPPVDTTRNHILRKREEMHQ